MREPSTPRPVKSVLDLIGNTPMVELSNIRPEGGARIVSKLESFNPGFSVKDRISLAMIRDAERSGRLAPGGTIIEPTAGNTGIALALTGTRLGYRVILVVPEHFSVEKRELMTALGGEVVLTPKDAGMKGAIAKAHELASVIDGALVTQQFANPANPEAHYRSTGPEIWEQTEGAIDAFVAGCGTGGTFTGVTRYLREKKPALLAVIADTEGSALTGEPGPHEVEGIGSSFIPETLDLDLADEIIVIPDPPAFAMVARLAREEGILAGSSAGANVAAAVRVAERLQPDQTVVTIIPDSAERYLSKGIYSRWRDRND